MRRYLWLNQPILESPPIHPTNSALFIRDVPTRQVHVIGFALDTPGDDARLRQIAENGNGVYLGAGNGAKLATAGTKPSSWDTAYLPRMAAKRPAEPSAKHLSRWLQARTLSA